MKKFLLLLLLLLLAFLPCFVFALKYPELDSKIVEIYDLNDKKVLYEIDSKKEVSIASLTKIATTITAIENIKNLDEEVIISDEMMKSVFYGASVAGLKIGDKVTYMDLLYASMLPSGADATNSIAISSFGSIDNFVVKMNDKIKDIGLKDTHFVNVSGLDADGHYSTADDVRKLLEYALKNDTFRKIYTTKSYELSNGLKVKSSINYYNSLLKTDTTKILGSKTGFTYKAGYCLSSLSNINGHEVLILVLNASKNGKIYNNIIDTVKLIEFLDKNYKYEVLVKKDELIHSIPVSLSNINEYNVYTSKDVKKYLPSDYDKNNIKIEYDGLKELSFKNNNDKIGTISYYFDNELLFKQDVLLDKKIKPSIKKILKKYLYLIIVFVLLLFLAIIILIRKRKMKKKKRK